MKTYLQLLFILLIVGIGNAQDTFSDDFETYNVGDYVGSESTQWTTWSGNTGGAEDAPVTDAQAASGNNSIAFVGASGGGPQDVVLGFGGKRTSGEFHYEMNLFVPANRGAYFNFQGESAPGVTWVMNARLGTNGNMAIDDTDALRLTTLYPQDEWFNLAIDVNLTSNLWRVSINGECIGSFDSANNYLASIDLFPIDDTNQFFVDDVSYTYSAQAEDVSFNLDAAIVSAVDGIYGITGSEKALGAQVSNTGVDAITSFTIEIETSDGTVNQEFTGVNITAGQSMGVDLDKTINLSSGGNNVKLSLLEVNGQVADENLCNNSQRFVIQGFTPAKDKQVYVEEATGTWCQWCPRGDVFMNLMAERYPDRFVGIAVHNGDPMAVGPWNAGLTGTPGFTGFPSIVVSRESVMDPSAIEQAFVQRVQGTALAYLTHGAEYDENTRELTVAITTHFNFPLTGDLRLFVGLTEDGVTGTGGGYAQVNAYAGGGAGVMGGYELLPSPVPASQMVYNHVGRYHFTQYGGQIGAYVGETIAAGSTVTHLFNYSIPPDFNHENMHIISAFIIPGGLVDNANSTTINEAVANGITSTIDVVLDNSIDVYPNPFSSQASIRMNFELPQDVRMEVSDAMGRLVVERNCGTISGDQVFPFDGTSLESGVYYLKLYSKDRFTTKKIVISH